MEVTNMSALDKIDRYIDRYEDMIYKVGGLLFFWIIVIAAPAHKLIEDRAQITLDRVAHEEYVRETNIEMNQLTDRVSDLSSKYQKTEFFKKETTCLAENIYYEAGTQGKEGMLAVAQVTLNRKRVGFAPSICGVVHQNCQFSWTCEPYKEPIPALFHQAYDIARKSFLNGVALTRLDKALYFHGDYIKPDWAPQKKFIEQIGQHKFYSDK